MDPAVAEALNELANVSDMRERLDEAEQRFRRAVDVGMGQPEKAVKYRAELAQAAANSTQAHN